ncbi:MAG: molybdopterin-dependent oxidoreductase [Halodesulfurarchaeum sp.]
MHVAGDTPLTISRPTLCSLPVETATITVVCSSGSRFTAEWTGVPLSALVEEADVPPSTTHLAISSSDGFRAVVPVMDAMEGMIAYLRDGVGIGTVDEYGNRFVSPSISGTRDVKGVTRIEPLSLSPGEDPESHEELFPDGDRFSANRYDGEN